MGSKAATASRRIETQSHTFGGHCEVAHRREDKLQRPTAVEGSETSVREVLQEHRWSHQVNLNDVVALVVAPSRFVVLLQKISISFEILAHRRFVSLRCWPRAARRRAAQLKTIARARATANQPGPTLPLGSALDELIGVAACFAEEISVLLRTQDRCAVDLARELTTPKLLNLSACMLRLEHKILRGGVLFGRYFISLLVMQGLRVLGYLSSKKLRLHPHLCCKRVQLEVWRSNLRHEAARPHRQVFELEFLQMCAGGVVAEAVCCKYRFADRS